LHPAKAGCNQGQHRLQLQLPQASACGEIKNKSGFSQIITKNIKIK